MEKEEIDPYYPVIPVVPFEPSLFFSSSFSSSFETLNWLMDDAYLPTYLLMCMMYSLFFGRLNLDFLCKTGLARAHRQMIRTWRHSLFV